MEPASLQYVGKQRLLRNFSALVGRDRATTARMLAYIGEIDRRRLYLELAYPSMFALCTERFRMSASAAGKRIRVSRAARRFPRILEMIRTGELHVSGVSQLAAHLTDDNYEAVLRRARHRSMREIDQLIAEISPKPDVAWSLRAMPRRKSGLLDRGSLGEVASAAQSVRAPEGAESNLALGGAESGVNAAVLARRGGDGEARSGGAAEAGAGIRTAGSRTNGTPNGAVTPLSPRRYKLQVTIGQEARDALEELRDLLSHQIPDGHPALVVERALEALLTETKKKKAALTKKPRAKRKKGRRRTRAIPAEVRREVFKRDGGQCAFVDGEGRRCASAWQLEFHHCVPYGRDGPHSAENVELRCRAHNQFEAERDYGRELMVARRGGASPSSARA